MRSGDRPAMLFRSAYRLLFLALLLLIFAGSPASASTSGNTSHGAIIVADGGCVVAGKVDFSAGSALYLLKVDSAGNEAWNRTYGEYGGFGEVRTMAATGDGYLIASTLSTANGSCIYLLKTDLGGNEVWAKAYGEPNRSYTVNAVIAVPDGFALTGNAGPFPPHGEHQDPWGAASHTFMLKLDRSGQVSWYQVYDGPDNDVGNAVMAVSDGYVIAGTYYFWEGWAAHLIKTDLGGNEVWNLTRTPRSSSVIASIAPASDGYLASGDYWRGHPGMSGPGSSGGYLLEVAPGGEIRHEYYYHITDGFDRNNLMVPAGDGYLLAGIADVYGNRSLYLFKSGLPGNESWYQIYPGIKTDYFGAAGDLAGLAVVDDGYVIAGPVNLKGYWRGYDRNGATGLHLFKTDLGGNVVWDRTYDSFIAREKPVGPPGTTWMPSSITVSPIPLATPSPAPGYGISLAIFSLVAGSLAALCRVFYRKGGNSL